MNIYIYSDESGVLDKAHNDIYVFGGVIVLGNDAKDVLSRKYMKAEKDIRKSKGVDINYELKATQVNNKEKGKLFRSLNNFHKFSVVINQQRVNDHIFNHKKSKQRYLDFAFKIATKRALEDLIKKGLFQPKDINHIYFFVDEHTTATNGIYELEESLENEFKIGTHNFEYNTFYPPIFPNLETLNVHHCNSSKKILVRCADIVANRIYYLATKGKFNEISSINNLHNIFLP